MSKQEENILYSRWLSGELTAEELEIKEERAGRKMAGKVAWAIDCWTLPELEEKAFEQIQNKIAQQKEEEKAIFFFRKKSFFTLTAYFMLIGGIYMLFNSFTAICNNMSNLNFYSSDAEPDLFSEGSFRQIKNTPMYQICDALSEFFNVKIVNENVDLNKNFSGRMNMTNVDSALASVLSPMDIAWKRESNTITIKNK